jgi:hypothetical protein
MTYDVDSYFRPRTRLSLHVEQSRASVTLRSHEANAAIGAAEVTIGRLPSGTEDDHRHNADWRPPSRRQALWLALPVAFLVCPPNGGPPPCDRFAFINERSCA